MGGYSEPPFFPTLTLFEVGNVLKIYGLSTNKLNI